MKSNSDREIAIYWDYENVILPKWCGPAEAAKKIYKSVSKYGRVVERRLYFDYQKHSVNGPQDCSGLDLSGFDLVNTPTRNAKETLDKKLIADVLTFAWDCTARNSENKPCVVLITSDGDYAYTLAKLRDRGVMNIIMFGKECSVAQILVENADVALNFEKDVLYSLEQSKAGISLEPPIPMEGADRACVYLFFKNLPAMENVEEFVKFIEGNQSAVVQHAIMFGSDPSYLFVRMRLTNANDGFRILNMACNGGLIFRGRSIHASVDTQVRPSFTKTPSHCRYEKKTQQYPAGWINKQSHQELTQSTQVAVTVTLSDFNKWCVCLHNEQVSRTKIQTDNTHEYEKCWVPISVFNRPLQLCASFSSKSKAAMKLQIKSIVDKSIFEGYFTVARKQVESESYVGVPWHKNYGMREGLSQEPYLRLTVKGRMLVQMTFHKKNVDDFLGFRIKGPTKMCSTLDGETFAPSSPLQYSHHCVVRLQIAKLPDDITAGEFVNFIENEHYAVVECAVVSRNLQDAGDKLEATASISDNYSSVDFLLANAQCGLMVAFLALTNGISFDGTQIKIKVCAQGYLGSMLEKMADCREPNLCYTKPENTSQKAVMIPISDDIRLKVIKAEREFCVCLFNEQKLIGNAEILPCDRCWVEYSIMGTKFQSSALCSNLPKFECKELLKTIREMCINDGLIEIGRRKLVGSRGYVNVSWLNERVEKDTLSKGFYLRLTDAGILLFQDRMNTKKKDTSCVFLQNLPWPMQVLGLVKFLEVDYKAAVQQACIDYEYPSDCCSAHVKFINEEDGLRICHNDIIMSYSGREIRTNFDICIPTERPLSERDPALFYTKRRDAAVATASVEREGGLFVSKQSNSTGLNEIAANALKVTEGREDSQLEPEENTSTGSIEVGNAFTQSVGVNDLFSDCDVTATNIEDTVTKPNTVIKENSLKLAQYPTVALQGSKEIDKAEYFNIFCQVKVETTPSRCVVLQKELDEVIRVKDFVRAASIQADIDCLENNNTDVEIINLINKELHQELHQLVEAKKFVKAAIMQAHIEGLEKGMLSGDEAKSLLREYFDTKLGEAVEAKDFVKASTIQNRIECLEQGCKASYS